MEPSNSSDSNNLYGNDSGMQNCANNPMKSDKCGDNMKIRINGRKVGKRRRLKKDSIIKPCISEPSVALEGNEDIMLPVCLDISERRISASDSNISGSEDNPSQLSSSKSSHSRDTKSSSRLRPKHSAEPCNFSNCKANSFSPSSKARKASVARTRRIPLRWWFGFSRSYEDGRAGQEGRSCYVLSEIEFDDKIPHKWFSGAPLSDWNGVCLCFGIVIICCLTIFPESTKISNLDLSRRGVVSLPVSIATLTKLTECKVNDNFLDYLPASIGSLLYLSRLDVSFNELTYLPASITSLVNLFDLISNRNQLTRLPESIGDLTRLHRLDLSDNQLTRIPYSIGGMTNLRYMSLSSNKLTQLPASIGNLKNLYELYVQDNQQTRLPDSIGNLTSLTRLNVDNNKLTQLPDSIRQLTSLTSLIVGKNPITSTMGERGSVRHQFERDG